MSSSSDRRAENSPLQEVQRLLEFEEFDSLEKRVAQQGEAIKVLASALQDTLKAVSAEMKDVRSLAKRSSRSSGYTVH